MKSRIVVHSSCIASTRDSSGSIGGSGAPFHTPSAIWPSAIWPRRPLVTGVPRCLTCVEFRRRAYLEERKELDTPRTRVEGMAAIVSSSVLCAAVFSNSMSYIISREELDTVKGQKNRIEHRKTFTSSFSRGRNISNSSPCLLQKMVRFRGITCAKFSMALWMLQELCHRVWKIKTYRIDHPILWEFDGL